MGEWGNGGMGEINRIMVKEKLFGKTLNELIAVTKQVRLPGYGGRQIADWLYKKQISSVKDMSNLSKKMREILSDSFEIGLSEPVNVEISADGTKKYLFKVQKDKYIETAYIPENDRATLCVSCQAGCKMGCVFCQTGRQGFQGNLTSNEILNQFRSVPEFNELTNIVYMGMGEPLDNPEEVLKSLEILTSEWGYGWSPSRITVSTVGLRDTMAEVIEKSRCHIAISLHSPFDEERRSLMPVQRSNSIKDILDIIRNYDFTRQRRISFEYVLFSGMNDSPQHVKELARILDGIKCRINIIRFHQIPGSSFRSPDLKSCENFRDALNAKGIIATIRRSRGEDIGAACGLLSTIEQNKDKQL
jgi:23S rRNA (adenine2503-C2)-methyltransferase